MLNVNLKADQLFVNALEVTLETLTPIVFVIPVEQILAVPMLSVKIMAMLPFANVLQNMLVIHMYLVLLILAPLTLVVPTPNVMSVDKDLSADVSEVTQEVLKVDQDV